MCYGFLVLAWWFMAWDGMAHTKNWSENHTSFAVPVPLTVIIFTGFAAFCSVCLCVHTEHTIFFSRPSYVYRVKLYPIGIHMRWSQWLSRFMIEYLTTFQSYRDFDGMCPCVYRNGVRLECQYCLGNSDSLFLASDLRHIHQAIWKFDWNTLKIIDRHSYFYPSLPSFPPLSRQSAT